MIVREADRMLDGTSGLRGQLVGYTIVALAEGVCFATLVPILRALWDDTTGAVAPWLIVAGVAAVLSGVARWFTDNRANVVGVERFAGGLMSRVGRHAARMPLGWFTRENSGRFTEIVTGSAVSVMIAPGVVLSRLVTVTVTPLVVLAVVVAIDWRMALAMAVVVPVGLLAYRAVQRAARPEFQAQSDVDQELSARVIEFARAQPVLRAAGRARSGWTQLDAAMRESRAATVSNMDRTGRPMTRYLAVVEIGFALIVGVGVLLVTGGSLAFPDLAAILVLAVRFAEPLSSLAGFGEGVEMTRAALGSVGSILAVPPLAEPEHRRPVRGSGLELVGVRFGYGEAPVLDGVDLRVPPGSMTALVGPSGAGKTTIIRLIARFWDADSGHVRIGGEDVTALGTDTVLAQVSVVSQDVYLFDDTIEANIHSGRPDATIEEVRAAASVARLDDVVARLPDGWHSRVGEGGAMLSGGERQRVSIARALLKDAPIVLLDEVTAALDGESEAAVVAAIRELARDRTVVVIAHRLSTISSADQIVYLDKGTVVESGTHEQLLARGDRYAALWHERRDAEGWQLRSRDTLDG